MMALMAASVINLSTLTEKSKPSIAFLDTLMAIKRMGIITGKLKIAIKVALLLALEAMPETMVKHAEKPMEPKNKLSTNKP